MGTVKIEDPQLSGALASCLEPAEVYDAKGKLLGLFVPANLERAKEMYAKLEAMIDWDEIRSRKIDPRECVPHEHIVAGLKALNEESERRKRAGEPSITREEVRAALRSGRIGKYGPEGQSPGVP